MLVELEPGDPPATLLSLLAGLAVIEALAATPPHYTADLKWPNDVLLDGAKAGGVLLERQGERLVVGIGLNLAVAPDVPGRRTAAFNPPISVEQFAPTLAGTFGNLFRRWRSAEDQSWLIEGWQACAHRPGTPLQVHEGPGKMTSGRFDGLETDGALRLMTTDGLRVIRAGDVDLG